MPPLERSDMEQTAVLWAATGKSDRYGNAILSPPVEIACRWITRKTQAADPQKSPTAVDATANVMQYIPIKSQLWLGTLAQWYANGSAGVPNDLMECKSCSLTPDMKSVETGYIVSMMRLYDATTA